MSEEFDWVGTRDPTPYLAAPAGLAFMESLGSAAVQRYNHELAWHAGELLAARWGTAQTIPEAMVGPMIAVRMPAAAGCTPEQAAHLRDRLLFDDGIEIALIAQHGAIWARVSGQIYNEAADIERLAAAVLRHLE